MSSPPPPPPRDDMRFSNTTCILQKTKLCGLLGLKRRVRPLLKKILDPPLVQKVFVRVIFQLTLELLSACESRTASENSTALALINPLSPKSDQHQNSPCKINAL